MVDFTEGQAGALGAAAGIGSSLLGGIFSARQAKSQMRFQRDMYKQRYQFQVEDLKKAGLNPMLAYQQAAPAAPGGAMGQMDAPDVVNSARAAALFREELKKLKQERYTMEATERDIIESEKSKIYFNTAIDQMTRRLEKAGIDQIMHPVVGQMLQQVTGSAQNLTGAIGNVLPTKVFDLFKKGKK